VSLTNEQVIDTASRLLTAEADREQIGLLSLQYPELDMDDAYRIQSEILAQKASISLIVEFCSMTCISKAVIPYKKIDLSSLALRPKSPSL
jgi:2-oxo-hept-3-ene-1,7-dioate hydratase